MNDNTDWKFSHRLDNIDLTTRWHNGAVEHFMVWVPTGVKHGPFRNDPEDVVRRFWDPVRIAREAGASEEYVREVERLVAYGTHSFAYAAGTADGATVTLPCQCACGFQSTSFATPLCDAMDKKGDDRE